jgi:hypothetical protein
LSLKNKVVIKEKTRNRILFPFFEKGEEKHPLHHKNYFTLFFRENKELLAFRLHSVSRRTEA